MIHDDSTIQYLDCRMFVPCRPALYIGRTQKFAPADDSTVQVLLSSDGAGAISKLKLWEHHLQDKVITSTQLQCNWL